MKPILYSLYVPDIPLLIILFCVPIDSIKPQKIENVFLSLNYII